jgi:hypothetical protein
MSFLGCCGWRIASFQVDRIVRRRLPLEDGGACSSHVGRLSLGEVATGLLFFHRLEDEPVFMDIFMEIDQRNCRRCSFKKAPIRDRTKIETLRLWLLPNCPVSLSCRLAVRSLHRDRWSRSGSVGIWRFSIRSSIANFAVIDWSSKSIDIFF